MWLSLTYLAIASALVLYAYRLESSLSAAPRPAVGEVVWGRSEPARPRSSREDQAQRSAADARAALAGVTLGFALGSLLVVGGRAGRSVGVSLGVVCLTLVSLELLARALGVHFPGVPRVSEENRELSVYDPTKGWFHVPGGSGFAALGGPDAAAVRINSLGLRGPEIAPRKPPGVTRVLVLGDSFAFGLGVDEEHLFSSHLERLLESRAVARGLEVVNMGVLGYSTDQELILFQELGMGLAPDLVILVACDNDFQGNGEDFAYRRYYKPYFELDENGELVAFNQPVPRLDRWQRARLYMGQTSRVWNFFRSRRSELAVLNRLSSLFEVGVTRPAAGDPVRLTAELIRRLSDRVEAAGARLLVINTGHRGERTPLFHRLRPMLEPIPQLGLEGFLGQARGAAPELLWDFPEDTHWNRDSHRLAAEIIAGHVIRHGLLRPEEPGA